MFSFLNPKIESFGIDLSDLSIKIVKLKKKGDGLSLASFGRQEIPVGLIENGEIKKEDELIEIIKKSLREIKGQDLGSKYCIASLPETVSFVRVVQLPLMDKSEVAEAIKWEIEANIPLSRDEIYYDWQIIENGNHSQHLDVLIGVLPKKTVDPYLDAFKKAGLKPISFEIESIALSRALVQGQKSDQPLVILDFGAKRTNLVIFANQAVCFTSSFSISNQTLISAISQKLGIDVQAARELKVSKGLDLANEADPATAAMKEPLGELVGKIRSYIDFFEEHPLPDQPKSVISRMVLCGGGANMTGLAQYLANELKMEVAIGDPWVNILKKRGQDIGGLSFSDSLSYATAIGLALEGMEK